MCRLCDVFIFYFLIGGKLLYNVVLVSGIWQCESVTIIYVSPSSEPLFPPYIPALKFIKEHQAGSLDYIATFHCFTHDGVYMSMLLAQFSSRGSSHHLPLLCPHICSSLGSSVSFVKVHIYVLISDTCFTLSDLLHSV